VLILGTTTSKKLDEAKGGCPKHNKELLLGRRVVEKEWGIKC
jgi:hypothetical protein